MSDLRTETSKSKHLKSYIVAEGKAGKTTFLAASCLGALPHQKKGLVDKPCNLHIIGIDSNAVGGLAEFLTKICGKNDAHLDVDVENMQDEARRISLSATDWDYSFFNSVVSKVKAIQTKIAKDPTGVHAVVMSSLTGLAEALQRGMSGPPNPSKKGGGMDESKWQDLSRQLIEIRNLLQTDLHHMFWEGHVYKAGSKDNVHEETGVPGKTGKNWGFNVDQVFRLRRELRVVYPNTQVEKQFLDTKPTLDFTVGGRGFTGVLQDREYDLVDVAERLGYKVGGFKG